MTTSVISLGRTSTSPAIVAATADPSTNGPTKTNTTASTSAGPGRAPLVATSVAIEFDSSWKPFVSAKTNASTTAIASPGSTRGA